MTTTDLNTRIDLIQKGIANIKGFLALGSLGEVQRELHNMEIDLAVLRQQVDEVSIPFKELVNV